MATVGNSYTSKDTKAAPRWQQWGSAAAANGILQWAADFTNDLTETYGVPPVAVICGQGGLLVVKDHGETTRALDVLAGVRYPCSGMTFIDGANTTADKVLFLYNHSETT